MFNKFKGLSNIMFLISIGVSIWGIAPAWSCSEKYQTLFDGSNLSQFRTVGDANWKIEGSTVGADSGKGFLITEESFKDYYVDLEFYVGKKSNSGIFFRCSNSTEIDDRTCYEANIFDTRPDQAYRTGAITNIASPKENIKTEDGNWHRYQIHAIGSRLRVILDGKETVYVRDKQHVDGPIALQFAQGVVKFRNIKIKKLPKQAVSKNPDVDCV